MNPRPTRTAGMLCAGCGYEPEGKVPRMCPHCLGSAWDRFDYRTDEPVLPREVAALVVHPVLLLGYLSSRPTPMALLCDEIGCCRREIITAAKALGDAGLTVIRDRAAIAIVPCPKFDRLAQAYLDEHCH